LNEDGLLRQLWGCLPAQQRPKRLKGRFRGGCLRSASLHTLLAEEAELAAPWTRVPSKGAPPHSRRAASSARSSAGAHLSTAYLRFRAAAASSLLSRGGVRQLAGGKQQLKDRVGSKFCGPLRGEKKTYPPVNAKAALLLSGAARAPACQKTGKLQSAGGVKRASSSSRHPRLCCGGAVKRFAAARPRQAAAQALRSTAAWRARQRCSLLALGSEQRRVGSTQVRCSKRCSKAPAQAEPLSRRFGARPLGKLPQASTLRLTACHKCVPASALGRRVE